MKILAIFVSICVYHGVSASSEDSELFPSNMVPFPFLKKLCPTHYYYNKLRKKCVPMPGGGNAVTVNCLVNCASDEVRAHPDYQQFYTVCSKGCFLIGKCSHGMIFDKKRKRCTRCCINIEICGNSSGEKDASTLADTAETSDEAENQDQTDEDGLPADLSVECPKNKKFSKILQKCAHLYRGEHKDDVSYFPKCRAEGSFRSPKHCSLYYLCQKKKYQRGFNQEKLHCPSPKKRFDPDLGKCMPKEQVKCKLPGEQLALRTSEQLIETVTNVTVHPGQKNMTVKVLTRVYPANQRSVDSSAQTMFHESLRFNATTNNSASTEKTQATAYLKCDQEIDITSTYSTVKNSLRVRVVTTSSLLNFLTGKAVVTTCKLDVYIPDDLKGSTSNGIRMTGVCETDLKHTSEKANVNTFVPLAEVEEYVELLTNSLVSEKRNSLTVVDVAIEAFTTKEGQRLLVDQQDPEVPRTSAIEVMLLYDMAQKEGWNSAIQPKTKMNDQTLVSTVALDSRKRVKFTLTTSRRDANTTKVQVSIVATNLSKTTNLSCVIRKILKVKLSGDTDKFEEHATEKMNNTRRQIVHKIVIPIDTIEIDVSDYSVDLLPRLSQDTHMTTKALEAGKLELYVLSLQNIAQKVPSKSCLQVTTTFRAPMSRGDLVFLPKVHNDQTKLVDACFTVMAHNTVVINVKLLLNLTESGPNRDVTTNLAVGNITRGLNVTCVLMKMPCNVERLTQKTLNTSNDANMTTITNEILVPMTSTHFELSKIVNIDVHPKFNKLVHVETRSRPGKLKIAIDSLPWQKKERSTTTKEWLKATQSKTVGTTQKPWKTSTTNFTKSTTTKFSTTTTNWPKSSTTDSTKSSKKTTTTKIPSSLAGTTRSTKDSSTAKLTKSTTTKFSTTTMNWQKTSTTNTTKSRKKTTTTLTSTTKPQSTSTKLKTESTTFEQSKTTSTPTTKLSSTSVRSSTKPRSTVKFSSRRTSKTTRSKGSWESESVEVLDDMVSLTKTTTTTLAPAVPTLEIAVSYTIPRVRKNKRKIKPKTQLVDNKEDKHLDSDITFGRRKNLTTSATLSIDITKHKNVASIVSNFTTMNLPSRVNLTCHIRKILRSTSKQGVKFEDETTEEIWNSSTTIIYKIYVPIYESKIEIGKFDIDVLPARKKPKHKVRQTLEQESLKIDVVSLKGPKKRMTTSTKLSTQTSEVTASSTTTSYKMTSSRSTAINQKSTPKDLTTKLRSTTSSSTLASEVTASSTTTLTTSSKTKTRRKTTKQMSTNSTSVSTSTSKLTASSTTRKRDVSSSQAITTPIYSKTRKTKSTTKLRSTIRQETSKNLESSSQATTTTTQSTTFETSSTTKPRSTSSKSTTKWTVSSTTKKFESSTTSSLSTKWVTASNSMSALMSTNTATSKTQETTRKSRRSKATTTSSSTLKIQSTTSQDPTPSTKSAVTTSYTTSASTTTVTASATTTTKKVTASSKSTTLSSTFKTTSVKTDSSTTKKVKSSTKSAVTSSATTTVTASATTTTTKKDTASSRPAILRSKFKTTSIKTDSSTTNKVTASTKTASTTIPTTVVSSTYSSTTLFSSSVQSKDFTKPSKTKKYTKKSQSGYPLLSEESSEVLDDDYSPTTPVSTTTTAKLSSSSRKTVKKRTKTTAKPSKKSHETQETPSEETHEEESVEKIRNQKTTQKKPKKKKPTSKQSHEVSHETQEIPSQETHEEESVEFVRKTTKSRKTLKKKKTTSKKSREESHETHEMHSEETHEVESDEHHRKPKNVTVPLDRQHRLEAQDGPRKIIVNSKCANHSTDSSDSKIDKFLVSIHRNCKACISVLPLNETGSEPTKVSCN